MSVNRSWIRLLLILPLTVGYATGVARAHGGGVPQLANAEAGPHLISVWTQPDPIRVGTAHFTVAVSEPPVSGAATVEEAGAPVLGATVELRLKPVSGNGETLVALATHKAAVNKLLYEVDVDLPSAGRWQVVVYVEGPAGSGNTSFEAEVLPPSTFQWWTLLGGLGLVLLTAGWIVVRGKN